MTERSDRLSVLLVDDDEATCTLVSAILRHDFHVEVAADGHDAIEKLRTKQFAAMLLDLRMPNGDGFSVLEFIRTSQPVMISRVVVVTASLIERDMKRVRDYGICTILPKPFEVEELRDAVRRCAEESSSGMTLFSAAPAVLLLLDLITQGPIR